MNTTRKFSDVLNLIEKQRKTMFETNPFFKIIADEAFRVEQRMLFIPYNFLMAGIAAAAIVMDSLTG